MNRWIVSSATTRNSGGVGEAILSGGGGSVREGVGRLPLKQETVRERNQPLHRGRVGGGG